MYRDYGIECSMRSLFLGFVTIGLIVFMTFFWFKADKITKQTTNKINEVVEDAKQYFEEEEELMETATIEKSTAIILDKSSKETEYGGYTSTSYMMMSPGMMVPMTTMSPSTSYTKYIVKLKLEDGSSWDVTVTKSEYSKVRVNDSVPVSVYRNDRKYELRKGSTDNIVSIELNQN